MKTTINHHRVLIVPVYGVLAFQNWSKEPAGYYDFEINYKFLKAVKNYRPDLVYIVTNGIVLSNGTYNESFFKNQLQWISSVVAEYCKCDCLYSYCDPNLYESNDYLPNPGMIGKILKDNKDSVPIYLVVLPSTKPCNLGIAAKFYNLPILSKGKFITNYIE